MERLEEQVRLYRDRVAGFIAQAQVWCAAPGRGFLGALRFLPVSPLLSLRFAGSSWAMSRRVAASVSHGDAAFILSAVARL